MFTNYNELTMINVIIRNKNTGAERTPAGQMLNREACIMSARLLDYIRRTDDSNLRQLMARKLPAGTLSKSENL